MPENDNRLSSPLLNEIFELNTQIIVKINWNDLPENEKHLKARKKFESEVQDVANFINEKTGDVILQAIQQMNSIRANILKPSDN